RALARAAPQLPGIAVLGPAAAPLAILRTRHRRRFLVKADRGVNLQAALRDWLGRLRVAGSARIPADIYPYALRYRLSRSARWYCVVRCGKPRGCAGFASVLRTAWASRDGAAPRVRLRRDPP